MRLIKSSTMLRGLANNIEKFSMKIYKKERNSKVNEKQQVEAKGAEVGLIEAEQLLESKICNGLLVF